MRSGSRAALATCLVLAAGRAAAQDGRAQITGVISDARRIPIPEAQVTVAGVRKTVTTDSVGRFRFVGLNDDTAVVFIRRAGYRMRSLTMRLAAGENLLNVELEEAPQRLDAAFTTVERTGLFGVVGDTAFNVLVGAEVSLAGRNEVARTDSGGAFAIDPVRPGANILEIRARGYKPRLFSFTMPAKGGAKVAIWMTPLKFGLSDAQIARESDFGGFLKWDLGDFDRRMRWKSSAAGVVARDELRQKAPDMRVSDAAAFLPSVNKRGIRVRRPGTADGNVFCAIVDGIAVRDPNGNVLDWYNTDDVESLELYPQDPRMPSDMSGSLKPCTDVPALSAAPAGRGSRRAATPSAVGGVIAVIILRR